MERMPYFTSVGGDIPHMVDLSQVAAIAPPDSKNVIKFTLSGGHSVAIKAKSAAEAKSWYSDIRENLHFYSRSLAESDSE